MQEEESMSEFQVGQEVHVDDPRYSGTWVVQKVPSGARGVNYTVTPKDGGRGLRAPAYMLKAGPAPEAANVETVPYEAPLHFGTVVRFQRDQKVYVVTGDSIRGGQVVYRIYPLGGASGYYRGVSRSQLTVIPLDKITIGD
jgi:hypothetical protein